MLHSLDVQIAAMDTGTAQMLNFKTLNRTLLVLGAALLAYEPVLWLVNTWHDPAYDSQGFIVFALCCAMFAWSASSPRITHQPVNTRFALSLLLITAVVRLISQVLAINIVGAIALVIDIYALALLAGLQFRQRPISPAWLALSFVFALPLERVLQRLIGYGLQHLSADTACVVLGSFFSDLTCSGIRIILNHQDVLVDLPCSGARTLLLLLLFYAVSMAFSRPSLRIGILGFALTLLIAFLVNVIRIVVLAIGIAFPESIFNIDVMAQPWHDFIGLILTALACAPIAWWAHHVYRKPRRVHRVVDELRWLLPRFVAHNRRREDQRKQQNAKRLISKSCLASAAFVLFAVIIVSLPRQALDVSKPNIDIALPLSINGYNAETVALSEKEKRYFTQYGGAAAKAWYGDQGLQIVRTSAPLRHLHAADECLRGLGFDVEYRGLTYQPMATAIYKATNADNKSFRIAISFISDQGHITGNIAETVWRWLQAPGSTWSSVQRISPWGFDQKTHAHWDQSLMAALDIATPSNLPQHLAQRDNHE